MREFGQARNLMAETTGKKMVIRAASKRAGGRIQKWLVEKGGRKRRWNRVKEQRIEDGTALMDHTLNGARA